MHSSNGGKNIILIMIGDLELNVMGESYDLIKDLSDDQKKRVIQWLVGKFDLFNTNSFEKAISKMEESTYGNVSFEVAKTPVLSANTTLPKASSASRTNIAPNVEIISTDLISYSIHGLFERVKTKTDVARVLLVAAYLQEKQNGEELGSRQINKELKSIGRGIKNITQAINSLLKKEPALLIMTRKTTESQQGKKKYMVTDLGMQKVNESLINGSLKV